MRKRSIALLAAALLSILICSCRTASTVAPPDQSPENAAFRRLEDDYVKGFLRHYPTVNTYLGGAGLDHSLSETDGALRNYTQAALDDEDQWLQSTLIAFERADPKALAPESAIDRDVAMAQIRFMIHLHQVRHYQQRSLDTYADEPFRSIDWQLQGMTQTGDGTYGTAEEWSLIAKRISGIPQFLKAAESQLLAGVKTSSTPDFRVLLNDGLDTTKADAEYFENTLPSIAGRWVKEPDRGQLLPEIQRACKQAAAAYRGFRTFIATTFLNNQASRQEGAVKAAFRGDRYAIGETEYNWALKNNFHVSQTASQLYEDSWAIVQATRDQMVELARTIGKSHDWALPEDGSSAVRTVFHHLSDDYPKSDRELIEWYQQAAGRLIASARKTGMFDLPADYNLEVLETPPPLRAAIDGAAYYPAPPFKNSGIGRFYVTTTDNNLAALKQSNRASIADLAAHEGFPGHDWHYKVMTQYRDKISPVRWLTPGEVEGSSSMWEDSMAAEGWALYAESLMAEPQATAENGFYTPEERLYQLQGKLYRDLRVRIDTGIHTGRMKYDDAVDLFSNIVDFEPGSCADRRSLKDDAKRASCQSAAKAIFRYSKWPTQAITYRLGKDEILSLRTAAMKLLGDRFSAKVFHLLFMRQGTIPAGYFREEFLKQIKQGN